MSPRTIAIDMPCKADSTVAVYRPVAGSKWKHSSNRRSTGDEMRCAAASSSAFDSSCGAKPKPKK